MGGRLKNSAVFTKIRTKRRNKLTDKDYEKMLNLGSVFEVAEYLSHNAAYESIFKNVDTRLLHRGELEERLKLNLRYEIHSLRSQLDMNMKSFFRIFDIQDEIEGIKFCASRIYSGGRTFLDEKYIKRYLALVTYVDFERLFKVENFEGFVSVLSETPYSTLLSRLKSDNTRQTLFDIETVLDLYYTRILLLYIRKYTKGKERKLFEKLYGSEIDLYNILTIIRSKKYYKMQNEEIYSLIFAGGCRLKKEDISRMVKAPDIETLMQEIVSTPYAKVFENLEIFFEKRINRYMYEMYKKILNTEPYSNAAVISYIHLKKLELKNIITVIESVRYGSLKGVKDNGAKNEAYEHYRQAFGFGRNIGSVSDGQ